MALGGQDVVGKGPVVGEQDKTGAGFVQAAGGEQLPPGVGAAHQVHHGGVPPVAGGADHPLGLVQHDVDKVLMGAALAVQADLVHLADLLVGPLADGPVDADPSGANHLPALAAGALGGLGNVLIQTHGICSPPLPGGRPGPAGGAAGCIVPLIVSYFGAFGNEYIFLSGQNPAASQNPRLPGMGKRG